MPTIECILQRCPEPMPEWLDGAEPPRFDREAFFASRTVYYPGSGDDGQPIKLCARSHSAHSFIYVDQAVSQNQRLESLRDRDQGVRGYKIAHQEPVPDDVLRPDGWRPHVSAEDVRGTARFKDKHVEPFAWFVALDRREGGEDHGPRRLAILFIGGDGFERYDALYCQGDGTPPPFLTTIEDYGLGGNFDCFGRGGLLEGIARRSGVWPKYLLVGHGPGPWSGYIDTGAIAEPGGCHGHPRRLFCRQDGPPGA